MRRFRAGFGNVDGLLVDEVHVLQQNAKAVFITGECSRRFPDSFSHAPESGRHVVYPLGHLAAFLLQTAGDFRGFSTVSCGRLSFREEAVQARRERVQARRERAAFSEGRSPVCDARPSGHETLAAETGTPPPVIHAPITGCLASVASVKVSVASIEVSVDSSNGSFLAFNGSVDSIMEAVERLYGFPEGSLEPVEAFHGPVEASYGAVTAFHGAVEASHGSVEAFFGSNKSFYESVESFLGAEESLFSTVDAPKCPKKAGNGTFLPVTTSGW
jgi:hypothetical protein